MMATREVTRLRHGQFDRRGMDKHVFAATFRRDEAKALR